MKISLPYSRILSPLAASAALLATSHAFAGTTAPAPAATGTVTTPATATAVTTAATTDTAAPATTTTAAPEATAEKPAKAATAETAATTEPAPSGSKELPGYSYKFIGARYRALVLPKFLVNAFVGGGVTLVSHSVGIEYEARKNGSSIIPSLSYQEYSTGGSSLFVEKGKDQAIEGNWSLIDSKLKSINAQVDFLWSANNGPVEFEYGLGVGMGVLFDNLSINWVYADPNGKYTGSNGVSYSACQTEGQAGHPGCTKAGHSNAKVAKVGGYNEPSWFDGGYKPVVLPIFTPQFGLRFKPAEQFAGRLTVGWGLTGPWFGFSGAFGFSPSKKGGKALDSDVYQQ